MFGLSQTLIAVVAVAVGYLLLKWRRYEGKFAHIPGPKGIPLLRNTRQLSVSKLHRTLTEWAKKYGPVYKVGTLDQYAVVVNGYDAIYHVLANEGNNAAGRAGFFRHRHHFQNTGLNQLYPDDVWRVTRRIFQTYMKQFSSGSHSLESAIADQSEAMFKAFEEAADKKQELNPSEIVKDTALKTIALIICGENYTDDDPVFLDLKKYEPLVWKILGEISLDYALLDSLPFLIWFPLRSSNVLKSAVRLRDKVTSELKVRSMKQDPGMTLIGSLCNNERNQPSGDMRRRSISAVLDEKDILLTTSATLFSGRGTGSLVFTLLINILAHNTEVQERIAEEAFSVASAREEKIIMEMRERMPYTQATLMEMQRLHSVVPLINRRLLSASSICGTDVPENTKLLVNIWGLHHDKEFWSDPESFRPERFLDEHGDLIDPGDPKRRRLLPFSTGVRSCPGEQFAASRLFLWLANTCKRLKIYPGTGNTAETIKPERLRYSFFLYPAEYQVTFRRR